MDADLILIFGFILLTLMFVMPMAYIFQRKAAEHEERKLELIARAAEAKAEEARFAKGDYSRMEERVRVLERIATDGNHALASQIEELRSLDRIEDRTEAAR